MPEQPGCWKVSETILGRLASLAGELRARGVRVGTGELQGALRALEAVDVGSRRQVRLALRSVLCSRHGDRAVFDEAFAVVFGPPSPASQRPAAELPPATRLAIPRVAVPSDANGRQAIVDAVLRPAAWSEIELSPDKDFALYTEAERAAARAAIARLAHHGARRASRRTRPGRRRTVRPDLARTVRASLRYGGAPMDRRWREPCERQRPLVLVCDVSGSMAPYARVLMQYLHACLAAQRRAEAFVFGTRLTRLTRELAERDPDRALARAAAAMEDWSGGTRIGSALGELNRRYGRVLGRGSVVVVLSDGWDLGDPQRLAQEMARLHRSAHRVIWLNPLKAAPGYEPLARGMAAALPHVDEFLAGNSLRSLGELAALLQSGMVQR